MTTPYPPQGQPYPPQGPPYGAPGPHQAPHRQPYPPQNAPYPPQGPAYGVPNAPQPYAGWAQNPQSPQGQGNQQHPSAAFVAYPPGPPVAPVAPPPDGAVRVRANPVLNGLVFAGCLAAGLAILYYQWYSGYLFDWEGNGRGVVYGHLIPFALLIVALVYLVRLLDRRPKLTFEGNGVLVRDKRAPDGQRAVRWSDVGRVLVVQLPQGRGTAASWVVLDRGGAELARVPASGHTPSPDVGLGQVAAIAAGRTYVG